MRLIAWFKNLKWIRAIRDYDDLTKAVNTGLEVSAQAIKMATILIAKEQQITRLNNENNLLVQECLQMKSVFAIHRHAAETSIHDANQARLAYENKTRQLNAVNDGSLQKQLDAAYDQIEDLKQSVRRANGAD